MTYEPITATNASSGSADAKVMDVSAAACRSADRRNEAQRMSLLRKKWRYTPDAGMPTADAMSSTLVSR